MYLLIIEENKNIKIIIVVNIMWDYEMEIENMSMESFQYNDIILGIILINMKSAKSGGKNGKEKRKSWLR